MPICGFTKKDGTPCKRKVGCCWQHSGGAWQSLTRNRSVALVLAVLSFLSGAKIPTDHQFLSPPRLTNTMPQPVITNAPQITKAIPPNVITKAMPPNAVTNTMPPPVITDAPPRVITKVILGVEARLNFSASASVTVHRGTPNNTLSEIEEVRGTPVTLAQLESLRVEPLW